MDRAPSFTPNSHHHLEGHLLISAGGSLPLESGLLVRVLRIGGAVLPAGTWGRLARGGWRSL